MQFSTGCPSLASDGEVRVPSFVADGKSGKLWQPKNFSFPERLARKLLPFPCFQLGELGCRLVA